MSDSTDRGPLDDLTENLTGRAAGDWSIEHDGGTQLPLDPEQASTRKPSQDQGDTQTDASRDE